MTLTQRIDAARSALLRTPPLATTLQESAPAPALPAPAKRKAAAKAKRARRSITL